MTFAILILALIVATCFIAYIADNIGKNLGKKRISILGLRPRQTATLISMAASVGVMLLTVAILMLTSASLRNALLRYDSEKKQANRVQREREKLQTEKEALLNSVQMQRQQINTQRKETEQFIAQRKEAEQQLKGASTRLALAQKGEANARVRAREAQARLGAARKQFQTFKKQLAQAKEQVATAKERVKQAQSQVDVAGRELKTEQANVEATRAKLTDAQAKLANAQKQMTEAQRKQREAAGKLAQAEEGLKKAEAAFNLMQAQVNKTVEDWKEAVEENAKLVVRRNEALEELNNIRAESASLKHEIAQYKSITKNFAAGELILRQGEVLADETVPPHATTRETLEVLRKLMAEGRSKISGARRTLTLTVPNPTSNFTEDELLRVFAAGFSTLEVPVSLRLAAARDHALGETNFEVNVVHSEIRTIFAKDAVLASANIDGNAKAATIFRGLLDLLSDGERRAGERGVAPLLTAENPHFFPTGTNEGVFDALREIQDLGGMARVKLVAANNISSIDFPSVKFEVTRQE